MTKIINKVISLIFLISIFATPLASAKVKEISGAPVSLEVAAKAALVSDATTGQVLGEKNSDQALPAASTSKMVTAYLVLEAIDQGKLQWDDRIKIDENTASISRNKELTNIELEVDQEYRVGDLFDAMIDVSTNATAVALGNAIAGDNTNFSKMMNDKVHSWGITSANFINAAGLDNSEMEKDGLKNVEKTVESIASAQDLAVIATKLFNDFPEIISVMQRPNIYFTHPNGKVDEVKSMISWANEHLEDSGFSFLAGKNGSSEGAGTVFVGLTDSLGQGRQLITVIMNSSDYKDPLPGFDQSVDILKQAMKNWTPYLIQAGSKLKGAEKMKMLNTEAAEIPVHVQNTRFYWINTKKGVEPIFKLGFSSQDEVAVGDILLTGLPDNFKGLKFLVGFEQNGDLEFVAEKASKVSDKWYGSLFRRIGL